MFFLSLFLRPMRVLPFLQMSSLAVSFLVLFLAAMAATLAGALETVSFQIQNQHVLHAYLAPQILQKQEASIHTQVEDQVRVLVGAAQVRSVGSAEFLKNLGPEYINLTNELNTLGDDIHSVVPRYIEVSGDFGASRAEQLEQGLKKIEGVREVDASFHRFHSLLGALKGLRWMSWSVSIALMLATGAVFLHWMRVNRAHLHETLVLLRQLGASKWRIQFPLWTYGAGMGAIVGAASGILAWYFRQWFANHMGTELVGVLPQLERGAQPLIAIGAWIGVGFLLGLGSSILSGIKAEA